MIEGGGCLAFEEALKRVADEEAALSGADLYALSAPSSAEVQVFQRQWSTLAASRRRAVVALLVESAEANFELSFNSLLRVTMEDEDDQVRAWSIEGLWETDDVTLIGPLVQKLRCDESPSVSAAAASLLGRFILKAELGELASRRVAPARHALLEAIRDPVEHVEVRRRAVESIAYLGEDGVHDIIVEAYESPHELMRISAVFAMGRSADTVWAGTVQAEVSNSNPAMRCEAARSCGELEIKEAVPALIRLISDPDREVQAAAVSALGQIGGARARRVLERCGRSDDEVLREAAEDALGELLLGEQPLDLVVCNSDAEGDEDEGAGGGGA